MMKLTDKEMIEAFCKKVIDEHRYYDQDYAREILTDIYDLVSENEELFDILKNQEFEEFKNKMWEQGWNDSLTGQYTGSYYCSTYKAKEKVLYHEELLQDALLYNYNDGKIPIDKAYAWEYLDCLIRCYLLDTYLDEFCDIWQEEIEPLLRQE